jgi:hypothetical protein
MATPEEIKIVCVDCGCSEDRGCPDFLTGLVCAWWWWDPFAGEGLCTSHPWRDVRLENLFGVQLGGGCWTVETFA